MTAQRARSPSLYWASLRDETPARIGRRRAGVKGPGHRMRILRYFARANPWESLIVLACLVLAALVYHHLATAVTSGIQVVVYAAIAFAVSWQATIAALLAGAITMGALHSLVRMASKAGWRQTRLLKSLLARLTDTLHEPKLLILDEATAALDPENEAAVWEAVEHLRGRVTVVAISHQPALMGVA